jgi:hypothetical protein
MTPAHSQPLSVCLEKEPNPVWDALILIGSRPAHVLVLTARFASLGHRPVLLGGTPWWNTAGATSSISSSAARLPRLIARILLIALVRQALHADSFKPAAVCRFCMPWLLDPFCFFSACPRPVSVAVCSILARYALLVGTSVADAAVPAGERVFAAGLVHSCLRSLSLTPSSRVARRCPPSFRLFGGAEAEAPLG